MVVHDGSRDAGDLGDADQRRSVVAPLGEEARPGGIDDAPALIAADPRLERK